MTSKSKVKGNNYERSIVKVFKDFGFESKRAYASNGLSLGYTEDVDVVVEIPPKDSEEYAKDFKIQCKRRKKLPSFLGLTETVDAAVFREDNNDSYIMLRLADFIELIK